MLIVRRNLRPLLVLLTSLLLLGMVPESAEAQLFSRLRARCRPPMCNPCPCPCPTPTVGVSGPCAVCPPSSLWDSIKDPSDDPVPCGHCTYYYDVPTGTWRYGTLACEPNCICVLPTEEGLHGIKRELRKECEMQVPDGQVGLRLELKVEGKRPQTFLLILPPGTMTLSSKKYQIAVGDGGYWEIEVSYNLATGPTPCADIPDTQSIKANGTSKIISSTNNCAEHAHTAGHKCVQQNLDDFSVKITLVN